MPPSSPVDPLTGIEAARFGVYVHFPYCLSKCPYCDFASIVAKEVPEERYGRALRTELERRTSEEPSLRDRTVDSIFIGGGTPSLWHPRHVAALLEDIHRVLRCSSTAEITLEANPGAADADRFAQFRSAGINRLSMGVQSFQPSTLKALGRAHDGAEAVTAFRSARAAGFDNVSMDFIYGVHGQTREQAAADARAAVALDPEHLSAYALTLEKEALAEEVPLARQLERGELTLPPDDVVVGMNEDIQSIYGAAGLHRYEVSNYAKPGYHSRHNALYWTGGEYLALGAGATGFWRQAPQRGTRYQNPRSAEVYFKQVDAAQPAPGFHKPETLEASELFEERLSMGLRLNNGVNLKATCDAYGQPLGPRERVLSEIIARGWAEQREDRVRLTSRGMQWHSEICARLI